MKRLIKNRVLYKENKELKRPIFNQPKRSKVALEFR